MCWGAGPLAKGHRFNAMPFSFVRQTSAVSARLLPSIDLNADVGEAATTEGRQREATLITIVTSVNVACGAHAGDPQLMRDTIQASARAGAAVGAHPGYPDRDSAGRRPLHLPPDEIVRLLVDQLARLLAVADDCDVRVTHVKPHGALYNQAADDPVIAEAVARAVRTISPALPLVGLAGSRLLDAGRHAGLQVVAEAFADRQYTSDGRLIPRTVSGAVIAERGPAVAQAVRIVRDREVVAADGSVVHVEAQTICVHGDTPGAAAVALAIREALTGAGVAIEPFSVA